MPSRPVAQRPSQPDPAGRRSALASSGGAATRKSGAAPELSAPPAKTPREGTIVLHEPNPQVRNYGGGPKPRPRPRPLSMTITTQAQKGRTFDRDESTFAGAVEAEGQDRPSKEEVRRLIEDLAASSAYTVSPERFVLLWSDLERLGVFKLPRHRGGIPPADKSSIRMTGDGKTWIFLRPSDAVKDIPQDEAERKQVSAAWTAAKLHIVNFHP